MVRAYFDEEFKGRGSTPHWRHHYNSISHGAGEGKARGSQIAQDRRVDITSNRKFKQIVDAAFFVREFLEGLGLTTYVKTSGGKGLHVVVPLRPKLDWKKAHAGTGEIAARIAKAAPETFVVNMAKDKRTRRIFIDFHRNYRGATAVAPFSLRAKANLPASTPLSWDDLRSVSAPEDLNYSTVPGIVAANGDAWDGMDEYAGDLAAALKRLG